MATKRGTIRQAADATGFDQAAVRRALEGVEAKGVGLAETIEIVHANADAERSVGHAAHGRGEGGAARMSALTQLKARKAELENQKLEMDLAKAARELIDREAVTRLGTHLIATARTALLSLGHRLAPKVAGKTDIGELARLIEVEVRDVLGALSDEQAFVAALDGDALS